MNTKVKKMVLTAIFAAMSIVQYIFPKFPLPFFPSFLEVNFSMLPIIISGVAIGPICGGLCVLLRTAGKLLFMGTTSAYVGEIMDLVLGLVVVLTVSLIYKFIKISEKKKTFLAFGLGIITWVFISSILNTFYTIPAYIKLYFDGDKNGLISMLSMIPNIDETNYLTKYIFYAVIPFNLLLSVVEFAVTFFVHKKINTLYYSENKHDDESDAD